MTRTAQTLVLILIGAMLLTACGKKGPVRPINSPPPVPQPCERCGDQE